MPTLKSAGGALPWFRMYADFLSDPKMVSLAFEDQRHFIAILALKASGVLDQTCAPTVLDRIVAQKIWVDFAIVNEVKKRLVAAELIEEDWQPRAWNKRQMRSDSSTERVRAHRALQKQEGNGDVTLQKRSSNALEKSREEKSREEKKETHTHIRKRSASLCNDEKTEKPKTLGVRDLVRKGVNRQHAKDWMAARRAKRLPLTETALADVEREAEKAKMTLAQAIELAAKHGWAGFRASWQENPERRALPGQAGQRAAENWFESDAGIKAKAKEFGITFDDKTPTPQLLVLVAKQAGKGAHIDHVLAQAKRMGQRFFDETVNYLGDGLLPVDFYAT